MAALSSLSPDQKPAGSGDFVLTCLGALFLGTRNTPDIPTIVIDGTEYSTTCTVGNSCSCVVPAAIIATVGALDVWVREDVAGDTSHLSFAVTSPLPIATSISPTSVTAGGSTAIAVVGNNFTSGSLITVDGVTKTTTFVDAQHIHTTSAVAFPEPGAEHVIGVSNPGVGDSGGVIFTVNNPVPTFSSVSPTSRLVGSGSFTLTINGGNFVHGVSVSGNGVSPSIPAVWVSASQLTIQIQESGLGNAGTQTYTITNPTPAGGSVTTGSAFTVENPSPTIDSISPSSATIGTGPITVTIYGHGFVSGTGASVAKWNGVAAQTVFLSDTVLQFTATNAMLSAAGSFDVTVTTGVPGGGDSAAKAFTVAGGTPILDYIAPNSFTFGSAPYATSLNGSNFPDTGWAVFMNSSIDVTAHASFVNSTFINVSLTSGDIPKADAYTLEVRNVPGGTSSAPRVINIVNAVPTISALSSNTKIVGAAAFAETVTGTNFITGTVGYVNGSPRATVVTDSTHIVVTVTATDLSTVGTLLVTAFNPGPGGGLSNTFSIAVNNPAPVFSSVAPNAVVIGSGNTNVILTGSGFLASSVVKLGAATISSVYNGPASITATIPSASLASIATLSLTVVNPTPGGGTSGAQTVQVTNPAPTITSLSPNQKSAGDATFTLTVNGTGFRTGNTTASWNGQARTTTVTNSTTLTFTVNASDITAVGQNSVTVTNATPGGGTSSPAFLNVGASNPVPTITSLTPNNLNQGSPSQSVAVLGTNLVAGSIVRWEGNDRATTPIDATHASFILQSGDLAVPGSHAVTVFNPAPGGGTSAASGFVVNALNPVPTISGISPPSILHGSSGFTLHILGTNYSALTTVSFGGAAKTPTVVSSTEITISILSGDVTTAGTIPVIVTNPAPGGGSTPAANFIVDAGSDNPTPSITTLSLLAADVGATGSTVTITGNGFISGSQAKWSGSNRTTVFGSATSITIAILTSDLVAVGNFPITVFNGTPGGGTSNQIFFAVNALVNPAPGITALSPESIVRGASDFQLSLFDSQSRFLPTTVAKFGGAPKTTTYRSPSRVDAAILAADVALSPGAVSRINPDEHHEVGTMNAGALRSYSAGSAVAPTITGPDPKTGWHFEHDGKTAVFVTEGVETIRITSKPTI